MSWQAGIGAMLTCVAAYLLGFVAGSSLYAGQLAASRATALTAVTAAEQCSAKIHDLNNAALIWKGIAEKGFRPCK